MIELLGSGDAVMNLIGLILIAALSGGIVAVSLRLRASSARLWLEGDRLRPVEELSRGQQSAGHSSGAKVGGARWLTEPFRLEGKSLYHSAEDRMGN
jgi:hypothetical protein